MFIIAPLLSGQTFASLFSTHPPVEKRIERLIGKQSAQALIR
jgi:heat shock protein HtpX